MAGGRGRGGGRAGHSSTPPAGGRGRGRSHADSPGSNDRGRGRGRSSDRGRGFGRESSTPGRGPGYRSYGSPSPSPGFGGNSSSYRQSPGGYSRGGGRSGRGGFAAEESEISTGAGVAAVAAEDRDLLLVGRDAKSPRVWELRVHPSQHFGVQWLEAVTRWATRMQALQQQQQQGQQQPPPPPPPRPQQPRDIPDDDYDFSPNSSEQEDEQAPGDTDDSVSDVNDDDAYDMLSYLNKLSLQDKSSAADNFSTATTAGSTCSGGRSVGGHSAPGSTSSRQQRCSGVRSKLAAAAAAASVGEVEDEGSDDDSEGSSEWETDSGAGDQETLDTQQQQQQQQASASTSSGKAAAAAADAAGDSASPGGMSAGTDASAQSEQDWSDADADAAVMAAEEQDLLQEAAPLEAPRGTPPPPPPPQPAAAAAAGGGRGGQVQGQQRQELLLVSLRLERQGLTDKQAQMLSSWFRSPGVCGVLSLCKLWLFNNALGDDAAPALATLIAASPRLVEIHLSHNQLGTAGAKTLLAAVPTARPQGLRPLWFRVEYNQINARELETFINEDCAARGLEVDVAQHVPAGERSVDDMTGRELNLSWNKPWKDVHVQMPWLSIQRSAPAEAAVLQAAKAVWSAGAARTGGPLRQQPPAAVAAMAPGGSSSRGVSSRAGGVVAAMAAEGGSSGDVPLPLQYGTPPPPSKLFFSSSSGGGGGGGSSGGGPVPPSPLPPHGSAQKPASNKAPAAAAAARVSFTPPPPPARAFSSSRTPPSAAAAAAAGSGVDEAPAGDGVAPSGPPPDYQAGPLMLFLDTSALLAMLGGNSATPTAFKLSLLQTLASNGRFGRDLPIEQQTFLVLADTVLKQIDSLKSADTGVGGPVRKFLDRGLDEVGPKGLDFTTVLAAHEGEGLVLDRQAAVAGSRAPSFTGPTGQKNDLAIIEVALFFRKELLEAAAAATAEQQQQQQEGAAAVAAADAQPVILVTNDNAQLQLAKSHGLPAFKLAGAAAFESGLSDIIKGGNDLTSSALRGLMGPDATAGMGRVAQRSLQDDFDGAVACLKGLVEAYEDLSGVLGRVSLLVNAVPPGGEAAALRDVQQLLQEHQHITPFEASPPAAAAAAAAAGSNDTPQQQQQQQVSVLEATQGNLSALEKTLTGWEQRLRSHHTPSRVLKWTSSGA